MAKTKTSSKAATKKSPAKAAAPKKAPSPIPVKKTVLYIDSSFFFPTSTEEGYADDYQAGRYSTTNGGTLQAPILLPVGSKMKTITIYFKNTSSDEMQVNIVRKSIAHWADTAEYLVSFEALPSGEGVAPDYFASVVINHFADAGKIIDKYLYYIMISNTGNSESEQKNVRGMRIEYN